MRALMAIVLFVGGILALDATADAQSSRYKRTPSYHHKYKAQPRLTYRERAGVRARPSGGPGRRVQRLPLLGARGVRAVQKGVG